MQSGQDPNRASFLAANCRTPPPAPAAGRGGRGGGGAAAPQPTQEYTIADIPGVVAAGERWKVLWEEPGNNADGIVTVDDEGVLVARNDKSDVLRVDRAGKTSIVYTDTYTGGALAANAKGQLFIAERSLNSAIWLLAPERRLFANMLNGEPLDSVGGGVLNDIAADNKGGVYFTMGGLYYANPQGVVSGRYGTIGGGGGGLILSPDEKTLYTTGRPGVVGGGGMVAFDIQRDGSRTNERVFADIGNDGTTVDAAGRIYTVRQDGIVVFSPEGKVLGVIGAPRLFVSLALAGRTRKRSLPQPFVTSRSCRFPRSRRATRGEPRVGPLPGLDHQLGGTCTSGTWSPTLADRLHGSGLRASGFGLRSVASPRAYSPEPEPPPGRSRQASGFRLQVGARRVAWSPEPTARSQAYSPEPAARSREPTALSAFSSPSASTPCLSPTHPQAPSSPPASCRVAAGMP